MIACPTEIPTVPPRVLMSTKAAVLVAMSFKGIAACRPMSGVCTEVIRDDPHSNL